MQWRRWLVCDWMICQPHSEGISLPLLIALPRELSSRLRRMNRSWDAAKQQNTTADDEQRRIHEINCPTSDRELQTERKTQHEKLGKTRGAIGHLKQVVYSWVEFSQNQSNPIVSRPTCRRRARLRNDLYCVEWGVKLYSLTHSPRQPSSQLPNAVHSVNSFASEAIAMHAD